MLPDDICFFIFSLATPPRALSQNARGCARCAVRRGDRSSRCLGSGKTGKDVTVRFLLIAPSIIVVPIPITEPNSKDAQKGATTTPWPSRLVCGEQGGPSARHAGRRLAPTRRPRACRPRALC